MKKILGIILLVGGILFVASSLFISEDMGYIPEAPRTADGDYDDYEYEDEYYDETAIVVEEEEDLTLGDILDYIKEILGSLSSIAGAIVLLKSKKKKK